MSSETKKENMHSQILRKHKNRQKIHLQETNPPREVKKVSSERMQLQRLETCST